MLDKLRLYVRFTRPFTLLPPLIGVVSGAITAWGSASNPHVLAGQPRQWTWSIVLTIVLGSACAALLNAASNVINQVYDFENDRINKPTRPLITGEISMSAAFRLAIALYVVAVVPTWLVAAWPAVTLAEKLDGPLGAAPVLRALRPRVDVHARLQRARIRSHEGQRVSREPHDRDPARLPRSRSPAGRWSLRCSTSSRGSSARSSSCSSSGPRPRKDFSDMTGDAAAGCRTLPIRFGVAAASRMIAPFFVARLGS